MTRKSRRLLLISCALGVLGIAAGLVLFALSDTIVFFRSPSEIAAQHVSPGTRLRLGGLVKDGTVEKADGTHVRFVVTDGGADVPVAYIGILPDLFREGQGVVAEGVLQADGSFRADSVLAKHDEKYMPKEVVEALKKQGKWQEGEGGAPAPALLPGRTSSAN
ncbi:cytochrome c maturation protein CcmE [Ancylobacter sp. 6x-1]|uniref:Cytochrome c-type biogenesis protein CcmE n=1 Tax=Ancylobacter crimeensis TaxID=2579147 RepID=A0ABT0D8P8_9HYPH|nr:cytochrome c maturation protein CcmE [Ancylobacter crimeensis]MCK0196330.1 cytochrome c maturation protein CcmE [Ancylobacter crimeensis]